MMDSEERERTYQFFLEEVSELLQVLETGLLTIQEDCNPAKIHDLMRAAHSLKGGAATVGLNSIETIAHRLETIFKALYVETEIDTELETLLLEAYDCLRSPLEQLITTGSFDSETALVVAESTLTRIETRLGDALQETDHYLPSSSDLGVDLVESLFEVDVTQGIEHLTEIVAHPQDYNLATELRSQAEVFLAFAEMLNLPGFGEIATETIAALDASPEAAKTIANLALEDFLAAREQVLAGDRNSGGNPSSALLAFSQKPQLKVVENSTTTSLAIIEPEQPKIAAETNSSSLVLVPSNSSLIPFEASAEPSEPEKETIDPPTKPKPTANLKIRVDSQRLEKINNFVGELVINRNSQILQQEQLTTILNKLQNRLEQFQRLTPQFQESSERISLAPNHNNQNNIISSGDFDALEMERYGQVYSLTQELVEETMQFEEAIDDLVLLKRQSDDTIKQQQKTLSQLRTELMWARMLPLKQVLASFPRTLRDLSVKYQKPVKLNMIGTEVLVDKGILAKLHDPLLHLIRNAFDHGIEAPSLRFQQGKPELGQIDIDAYHQGNQTLIEIKDDGGGLDLEKIARKAIERGWLSVTQLATINQEELLDLIFKTGFSTAEQISELSGRGVGLDVVRSQLEEIKGEVTVKSIPGKGTTFTLSLPLTQTIASMLVCRVDSSAIAIPATNVREVILPQAEQIIRSGNQRMLSWREQLLPVYRLGDLLEYRYPAFVGSRNQALKNIASSQQETLPLLVISQGKQDFILEIEGLSQEQELVIKPWTGKMKTPNYIYGCAVLGDGGLIPAVAPTALLAYVREQNSSNQNHQKDSTTQAASEEKRLVPTALAVDDSAMMRRILTHTLEKIGYRVLTAKDGWEALELLNQSPQIQLIISDLEMPKLNGLELLHRLRQNSRLAQIPVVLLTSRSSAKHRALAMTLGANAYLTKPYIEQEFLAELRKILGNNQKHPLEVQCKSASHQFLSSSIA
ncbi:Hybrid sensor histidine kinase/response regulator [Hyella patelloides LEGE 07179]|uniref:histidine kinase n=1 Tax=Hyella patelloides LEGE 07179 TaxID=945734 RepID=A0A563VU61_9CYAN|nr:hybrid sensor histidine kinase/response regulator [Hyella patelloides]VEP14948.1 Hybrid sensor histidine kinase/response regulator [Hyella patelloides LEGE 07179]